MIFANSHVLAINFSPFGTEPFITLGRGSRRINAKRSPLGVCPICLIMSSMTRHTLAAIRPMHSTIKIPIASVILASEYPAEDPNLWPHLAISGWYLAYQYEASPESLMACIL